MMARTEPRHHLFSSKVFLMDPQTASYYRAILFTDGQDSRPLPQSLLRLHAWAIKRHQAMGLGGTIAKASALAVAMTWLSSTNDGREFAKEHTNIGDLFVAEAEEAVEAEPNKVDWSEVEPETPVLVMIDDKPTAGHFVERRGRSWIDIRINGETKKFRCSQVRLSGA